MRFEDFTAGQVLEFGAYEVTEQEVLDFARQFDPQPFHVDPEAAKKTPFGGLIASGFHTCGIAMRMVADHLLEGSGSRGSPGMEYVKWRNPVRPGDVLRVRVDVLEVKRSASGGTGILRWRWRLSNQKEEEVLDLAVTSLFGIRPGQGSGAHE